MSTRDTSQGPPGLRARPRRRRDRAAAWAAVCLALGALACGSGEEGAGGPAGQQERGGAGGAPAGRGDRRGGPDGGDGGSWGGFGGEAPAAAVPVEVTPVVRRAISSYIETNGTVEAENEVDVVARAAGPIVALQAEEGDRVRRGQVLARLDEEELESRVEISRVNLNESRQNYERAQALRDQQLISREEYEQALTRYDTAKAQLEGDQIQLGYTVIRAPFDGLIVARYVDFAEQVSAGSRLFRISDFDPLLCPIQVPERDLPALRPGQRAYLTLEAWPGERFAARVLRVSPVVDAATGTVKVTLEVEPEPRLRPGMFARVFVETDTRPGALVVPKAALSLESLGDTVYVADGAVARRRDVRLGFQEGDFVEVVSGLEEGERVVVVGQDGLSDETPIRVLGDGAPAGLAARVDSGPEEAGFAAAGGPGSGGGGGEGPRFDPSRMSGEQLEQVRRRMRERGFSEQQIEARLGAAAERSGAGDSGAGDSGDGGPRRR